MPWARWNCWFAMIVGLAGFLAAGCQQKMADQPSYEEYEPCELFADGTTAQQLVPGTVPRGHLRIDSALFAGRDSLVNTPTAEVAMAAGERAEDPTVQQVLDAEALAYEGLVTEFPLPVSRKFVEHGRNRYMIYCVVCHDAVGDGRGKIVDRGYTRPPSYHIERLRSAPVGYLFRVIGEGYGSMPSYAAQIPPRDRWAIVAYLRALQLSQHFPEEELPETLKARLRESDQVAARRAE